jgi:hypothetical protein
VVAAVAIAFTTATAASTIVIAIACILHCGRQELLLLK